MNSSRLETKANSSDQKWRFSTMKLQRKKYLLMTINSGLLESKLTVHNAGIMREYMFAVPAILNVDGQSRVTLRVITSVMSLGQGFFLESYFHFFFFSNLFLIFLIIVYEAFLKTWSLCASACLAWIKLEGQLLETSRNNLFFFLFQLLSWKRFNWLRLYGHNSRDF